MVINLKSKGNVYVIAEAGVNHNGDLSRAEAMIDAAANAGADAIKFQTFKAEELASSSAAKAPYQESGKTGESQLAMLRQLELSKDDHKTLQEHCKSQNIEFLSSPFDLKSLNFLVNELKLTTLKFGSGEVANGPLLMCAAREDCNVILSTGMSNLEDVTDALSVLAFGYLNQSKKPSRDNFERSLNSSDGKAMLSEKVSILHCTTEYPTPPEDVNLCAMDTLYETFGLCTGLSDHTLGNAVAIAAVARGANIIEKHFTLDRSLPGPDHKASLEPDELTDLINSIRIVESAFGDGVKQPAIPELENLAAARKSLVALKPIRKGDTFSEENLGVKRPGTGVSPMKFWQYLGQSADRDYEADELIQS